MVRALPIILLAMLLPLGGAAQPSAPAVSGDPALDRAVKKANTDWIIAMHSGDAAKEAEPYEEDGVFVALDGTATRGRAQIEAMMKQRFIDGGLAITTEIEPHRILREGKLAIEFGTAKVGRASPNGQEVVHGASYLTVWRLQDDGSWKIHRNLVLP